MLEDLQQLYEEILEEGRVSKHQFSEMTLKEAYQICYNIFKQLGEPTAATFNVMNYIYQNLPNSIKTPEVEEEKRKNFGAYLRPFVIDLVNNNMKNIDIDELKMKMVDKQMIRDYINRPPTGSRRKGIVNQMNRPQNKQLPI
jgi:hypothetical protein